MYWSVVHNKPVPAENLPAEWTVAAGSGLRLDVASSHNTATFRRFFAEYDKAFALPSEKEEESGFVACLALNHGTEHRRLARDFGPFAEVVVVASDPATGAMIGGANFIALTFAGPDGGPVVTSNLNYIFTTAAARGKGYFRRLLAALEELIGQLFPGPAPLVFIEQNDPFRMADEAYAEDSAHAGIDQFDRLLVWAKAGARVLDFAYVQPALSAGQTADDTLAYAVLRPDLERIDATLLAEHLRRFFAISVRKGAPSGADDAITAQLAQLAAPAYRDGVAALDPLPLLCEIAGASDKWARWPRQRPHSLVEALRA